MRSNRLAAIVTRIYLTTALMALATYVGTAEITILLKQGSSELANTLLFGSTTILQILCFPWGQIYLFFVILGGLHILLPGIPWLESSLSLLRISISVGSR